MTKTNYMKTKGLFLSALMMGAVLAGCSSDNDVMNNEENKGAAKGDSYIAVNIVNPGVGSRAADDAVGTDEENEVKSALFVFFNDNGGFVQAESVDVSEFSWNDGGEGPASKVSNAVIVLSKPTTYPSKVVALLNTGLSVTDVKDKNLSDIQGISGDYIDTTNGFAMSNSAYLQDGNNMVATPLTDANIQSSEALAKENPVTITVERVLAKVSIAENESLSVTGKDVKLDGANITLEPEIVGYQIVQTNPKSYLLKNIDGINATWNWNDDANFRSYWANSWVPQAYTYYSYNEVEKDGTNLAYCHENTSGAETATTLLVAAKIKAEGKDAETIIKYKGMYYTEKGLNTYINSQLSECYYTVDANDSQVAKSNDWSNYLKVQASSEEGAKPWAVEIVLDGQPATATAEEVAAAQAIIDGLDKGMQWTDGDAYFYVPIKHNVVGQDLEGVVRNHFYQLSVNSISGLGTPVYDPSEKIEFFDKPTDEEYYIAAKIQILKWNMVSQDVALE